jgi:hypothetical protein
MEPHRLARTRPPTGAIRRQLWSDQEIIDGGVPVVAGIPTMRFGG